VSVKYGLLALLDEAPSHGYNLKTAFERRTGGSWALNIGQVYTTIQRLERDGLVRPVAADDDRRSIEHGTGRGARGWFETVVPRRPP
jgi:DNA-binding PadR family transcriptional regulator